MTITKNVTAGTMSDLRALSSLACEIEIAHCLTSIASRFGSVLHVHPLPALLRSGRKSASFMVVFDTDVAAMLAAREMDCPMFGFTTVIVSIPRVDDEEQGMVPQQAALPVQFNENVRGMI